MEPFTENKYTIKLIQTLHMFQELTFFSVQHWLKWAYVTRRKTNWLVCYTRNTKVSQRDQYITQEWYLDSECWCKIGSQLLLNDTIVKKIRKAAYEWIKSTYQLLINTQCIGKWHFYCIRHWIIDSNYACYAKKHELLHILRRNHYFSWQIDTKWCWGTHIVTSRTQSYNRSKVRNN